jgi:hypothetical protein
MIHTLQFDRQVRDAFLHAQAAPDEGCQGGQTRV